jgi:hypothetical protein
VSLIVDRGNIDFVLYELLGVGKLLAQPRFNSHDRSSIATMLDAVQSIAETTLLSLAGDLDAKEPELVHGRARLPKTRSRLGMCGLPQDCFGWFPCRCGRITDARDHQPARHRHALLCESRYCKLPLTHHRQCQHAQRIRHTRTESDVPRVSRCWHELDHVSARRVPLFAGICANPPARTTAAQPGSTVPAYSDH